MDKFDLQIAALKPTEGPARLDEKQFMKKLTQIRRSRLVRRALMGLMGIAVLAVVTGAVRRDILDVFSLTFRYFGDLPSMLTEYSQAYVATIAWPSVIAIAFLGVVGGLLIRSRNDLTAVRSRRTYHYAAAVAVLAVALGITGMLGTSTHAHAEQQSLKRTLNERGHLEVQVGGKDYELYAQSQASDKSINNQATIAAIRTFDISKAYPELQNMYRDGFVAEVRAVNTDDDCIFYVERRLEPALNKVVDANAACIHSGDPVAYLDPQLHATKAPQWKIGQTMYITGAKSKDASKGAFGGYTSVVVLLDGTADQYIARNNGEQLVPKGQPAGGVYSCGINNEETCPRGGSIDVFTNAEGQMADGEIGSSVPGNSLQPRPGSNRAFLFGKIIAMDDKALHAETPSGKKLVITWPHNIIEEFNAAGATTYKTTTGALHIQPGDYLMLHIHYQEGMSLEKLLLSDVSRIDLAIKTSLPDPLKGETYSKGKADFIEKY
jgi:hypothetical protein